MVDPQTVPSPDGESAEITPPTGPLVYDDKKRLNRYIRWYSLAAAGAQIILVSGGAILLPNHIQLLEFSTWFTGVDAGVDLQQLTTLKLAVDAGTATATADQARLLGILANFESTRAAGLALVVAIATIVTMIVQPIVGVLSDRTRSRLGRRAPWIVYGAIIGFVALVGLAFSPSVALVAVFWTLAMVALNSALTPLLATVADRVPEERRGLVSSMTGFGGIAGGLIGSIAAGIFFASLGLSLYVIFGFLALAGLLLFVLRNKDVSSKALALPPFKWGQFFLGFLVPFRARDFRWVWLARLLLFFGYSVSNALAFYALQSYIQPNLSAAEATALTPIIAIAGVPGTIIAVIVAGRISDHVNRRKPFIIVASVLMALSMLTLVVWPSVPALFIQTVVGAFAFGIFLPVDQALFVDVLPDMKSAGRDLGMATVAQLLGTALAPILAAGVVAVTGGYQAVWIVAFVLVAVAAVVILPVRRP